jgi:hypothetical protein
MTPFAKLASSGDEECLLPKTVDPGVLLTSRASDRAILDGGAS